MTEPQPQTKWPGFKYAPVQALVDRLIARQLRAARKTMRRFFAEREMFEFAGRMDRVRKSNQSMMVKNQRFQAVLDEYAERIDPRPQPTPAPDAEVVIEE